MKEKEILQITAELLEEAKCALLATVSKDGVPKMRWMTPLFLRDGDREFYCITSPESEKIKHLQGNNNTNWQIQKRDLTEIINIKGKTEIIDNPSLKSQIIEKIGKRLHAFWKQKDDSTDFLVLMTSIDEIEYFTSMKGKKEKTRLRKG